MEVESAVDPKKKKKSPHRCWVKFGCLRTPRWRDCGKLSQGWQQSGTGQTVGAEENEEPTEVQDEANWVERQEDEEPEAQADARRKYKLNCGSALLSVPRRLTQGSDKDWSVELLRLNGWSAGGDRTSLVAVHVMQMSHWASSLRSTGSEQVSVSNRGGKLQVVAAGGRCCRLSKLEISPNGLNMLSAFCSLLCHYCPTAVLIAPSAPTLHSSFMYSTPSSTAMTGKVDQGRRECLKFWWGHVSHTRTDAHTQTHTETWRSVLAFRQKQISHSRHTEEMQCVCVCVYAHTPFCVCVTWLVNVAVVSTDTIVWQGLLLFFCCM